MERTLQVLDYAILVISGTDGVQGHTRIPRTAESGRGYNQKILIPVSYTHLDVYKRQVQYTRTTEKMVNLYSPNINKI